MEVVPVKFNAEDGLYELTVPGATMDVSDWADIEEGMVIEATVTGFEHAAGSKPRPATCGRSFPPARSRCTMSSNLEEFVGKKLACVVTEANPERRNLVLSHRAVLEREREESRQQLHRNRSKWVRL